MTRGLRFLFVAGFGLITVFAVCFWLVLPPDAGPFYKGETLYHWVWVDIEGSVVHNRQADEAEEAIRQIGNNAIPTLLRWTKDTRIRRFKDEEYFTYSDLAAHAFEILKTDSGPAIPELLKIVGDKSSSEDAAIAAATKIPLIDSNAVSVVAAFINEHTNFNRHCAMRAAHMFCYHTGESNKAVLHSEFVRWTRDHDERVAAGAIRGLGILKTMPNVTIPVLTNSLNDERALVRAEAIRSLVTFTNSAEEIRPLIKQKLVDRSPIVCEAAVNGLSVLRGESVRYWNDEERKAVSKLYGRIK